MNMNLKLAAITKPENRLLHLQWLNGKDIYDGFIAELAPIEVDMNTPLFKEKGVECDIEYKDSLPIRVPDIRMSITIYPDEFTDSELKEVLNYMWKLQNPLNGRGWFEND